MSETKRPVKQGFKRILVAVDGSENADRAARIAIDLAENQAATLTILNVIPIPTIASPTAVSFNLGEYFTAMERDGRALVDRVATEAHKGGVKAKTKIIDNVASTVYAITKYAEENDVDLIVLGSRGLGGFKKLVLGSVSSGVLSHAHCAVLVTR